MLGATIFTAGPYGWQSFEIDSIANEIIAANSPAIPDSSEGGGTVAAYTWKEAFAPFAAANPDVVGDCASEISYYRAVNNGGHQLITQFGTKAKLEYNEGAGFVAAFPFVR